MRLRSGTLDDVETFTRLVNAQHQWLRGENLWESQELAALLISPTSDPVRYDRYVEVDGTTVAGLHTHTSPPYEKGSLYLAAPPVEGRTEHVRYLLDSGLRLLRSRPEMRGTATINLDIPVEDTELLALAQSMGFTRANRVAIMEADLATTASPSWPADAVVRTIDPTTDLAAVYRVIAEAFATEPSWWHVDEGDFFYALRTDPTAELGLSFVVHIDDQPAGALVSYADTTRDQTALVGNLGVRPEYQGRGLGTALLLEAFHAYRSRGWQHARLATISGYQPGEPSVYRNAGMTAIYFNEMMLRPLDW